MTTTLAFDEAALLRLSLDRVTPDDGHQHLVEAHLAHRDDGRLELTLMGDDSDIIATVELRSDWLHQIITSAIAVDRRSRIAA